MTKPFCKTYIKKPYRNIYKYLRSYSELSVWFFFNRMGHLFNCEDHFYFYIYIHISQKKIFM